MTQFQRTPLLSHPQVVRAAAFFQTNHTPAWLVGGVVRDAFLNRTLHDIDIAVVGDGVALARRLADALGGAFVVLDSERGVGRAVVKAEDGPLFLDVASLRGSDSTSITADLWLRDFTINAMALDMADGTLIDPTGGGADLEAGQIRAVSEQVFEDDPLRMLRAVRQAAQLGFTIAEPTQSLMARDATRITRPSGERVRDELLALLAPAGAANRVRQLDVLGILAPLMPEIASGKGITQSHPHILDVFEHNVAVLDAIEHVLAPFAGGRPPEPPIPHLWLPDGPLALWELAMRAHLAQIVAFEQPRWLLLKLIALLHDVGKPATRTVGADGRIHFYRHDEVGAQMADTILRRLKFPAKSITHVSRMIGAHLRPLQLSQNLPPSRKSIYRFFRDTGDAGPDVALLSIADQRGKVFVEDRETVIRVVQEILHSFFEEREALVQVTPLLSGHEIMTLMGLPPGPKVGQLLERLREGQAIGRLKTRDDAIAYLQKVVSAPAKPNSTI